MLPKQKSNNNNNNTSSPILSGLNPPVMPPLHNSATRSPSDSYFNAPPPALDANVFNSRRQSSSAQQPPHSIVTAGGAQMQPVLGLSSFLSVSNQSSDPHYIHHHHPLSSGSGNFSTPNHFAVANGSMAGMSGSMYQQPTSAATTPRAAQCASSTHLLPSVTTTPSTLQGKRASHHIQYQQQQLSRRRFCYTMGGLIIFLTMALVFGWVGIMPVIGGGGSGNKTSDGGSSDGHRAANMFVGPPVARIKGMGDLRRTNSLRQRGEKGRRHGAKNDDEEEAVVVQRPLDQVPLGRD